MFSVRDRQTSTPPSVPHRQGDLRHVKIFDFDRAHYAEQFKREGWVHIPGGVSREFHAYMVDFATRELSSHLLPEFAIKGKKEQALFEFRSRAWTIPASCSTRSRRLPG